MYRVVIPLGDKLAALGVDPVGLYLQGISTWADFTEQARLRFNNTMLDCLAHRYRKIRDDGYSHHAAREEIILFDTGTGIGRNFRCSVAIDNSKGVAGDKSWSQSLTDFFTDRGRSTVALAELGMTSSDIVDLIEQFENEGGQDKHADFSIWLQNRLLKNVRTRKEGLTRPILEAQKKVAKEQLAEAKRLMAAIEAEIGRLKPRKPKQPKQVESGGKKNQPVAEGQGQEADKPGLAAKSDGGAGKEEPEPPKVTLKCDMFAALVSSVERQLSGGRLDNPDGLMAELESAENAARKEGNCGAEVFSGAASNLARLQEIAALRQKINVAISVCNIDAIPPLKVEIGHLPSTFFTSELSLLETAKTAVSVFKTGHAAYEAGKYRQAKTQLQRSLSVLRELPSGACQTYGDRAEKKGVGIIEKIEVQQARVSRAITQCDVDALKKAIASYEGKKHRFYKGAIVRMNAALPKCENNDRIIPDGKFCELARVKLDAARADFVANKLKKASSKLRKLDAELAPEKTKRCSELKGKVRQGLTNIRILKTENSRLQQAISDCKVEKLHSLKSLYLRKKHPWYDEAAVRARDGIGSCAVKQEDDCRRQATDMGKVFASIEFKENGEYSCHTCEKGQKPEGNVCVPDRYAAVADCRRVAADKGKVYAKTEIGNNGTPVCHWCEPGQISHNGQCGTRRAHEEANCRQLAAEKGKVYARTQFKRNAQVRCHWCEPGQFYRKGKCHSRVVRTCPRGYVLRGTRCYPRGEGQRGGDANRGGGALYSCTYNSDGSLLGGGSTSTVPSPYPIPGAKCVRVR